MTTPDYDRQRKFPVGTIVKVVPIFYPNKEIHSPSFKTMLKRLQNTFVPVALQVRKGGKKGGLWKSIVKDPLDPLNSGVYYPDGEVGMVVATVHYRTLNMVNIIVLFEDRTFSVPSHRLEELSGAEVIE